TSTSSSTNRATAPASSPRSARAPSTCACAPTWKRWSGKNETGRPPPRLHAAVVGGARQERARGVGVSAGAGEARAHRQDGGDAGDAGGRGAARRRRAGAGA